MAEELPTWRLAQDEFISQWGAIGSAWGINRTLAMIHALLMTSAQPLTTDEIMAKLEISRGNASTNLRDLIGWGLIRQIVRKGERKEYFEAEKEVWKIFSTVARERKRRELVPALDVLSRCAEQTRNDNSPEAKAFHQQMTELQEFLKLAERIVETVATSEQGRVLQFATKFFLK